VCVLDVLVCLYRGVIVRDVLKLRLFLVFRHLGCVFVDKYVRLPVVCPAHVEHCVEFSSRCDCALLVPVLGQESSGTWRLSRNAAWPWSHVRRQSVSISSRNRCGNNVTVTSFPKLYIGFEIWLLYFMLHAIFQGSRSNRRIPCAIEYMVTTCGVK